MAGCRCEKEVPSEPRTVLVAEVMSRSIGALFL